VLERMSAHISGRFVARICAKPGIVPRFPEPSEPRGARHRQSVNNRSLMNWNLKPAYALLRQSTTRDCRGIELCAIVRNTTSISPIGRRFLPSASSVRVNAPSWPRASFSESAQCPPERDFVR